MVLLGSGLPEVRLVQLQGDRAGSGRTEKTVSADAVHSQQGTEGYCLQHLPVRERQRLGVGRGSRRWRQFLADGSKAVGLFNLEEVPMRVTAKWSDLDIMGKHVLRDVWRQRDLGVFSSEYSEEIPRHGCVLLKVSASK